MIRWTRRIGIFIIIGILTLGRMAYGDEPAINPQPKTGKGKVFTYSATKLGLHVLKATIKILEEKSDKGKLFKVQAIFQSNPSLEFLFRMNTRFTSTLEAETYTPLVTVKEISHGGLFMKNKNQVQTINFNPARQKAVVELVEKKEKEKKEYSLPPGTYDPLSMFARFYLRGELTPGRDIPMSIFDGARLRQIVFHYHKDRIRTKLYGEVEAVRLESKTHFATFGDQEGGIRIWYMTDARKTPVLVETDLPVGTIRFELESVEES
ncbi:MAG: DUF3108 domain-containing protein [Deltaproteobacteria bacterium]|nr:DUF3108 domain-containing protein [Deltaproteobacteria bacterium]